MEHIPLDVSLNIFSRLEFSDRMNLLKVSKQVNEIVRDVVSVGNRNSLDGIIIGLPKAGSTTVFWQLVNQKKDQFDNRLNKSVNISNTPDIDTTKQGLHYLRRISLSNEGRTAILFHGSSKSPTNKNMYPYYGLAQAIVIVIPAQIGSDFAAFKKSLKQLLMPVFALCGHMNWIFAINKMDLIEYSEAAFNEVVTIVTQVCQQLSQNIVDKVSFIPISATHSQNLFENISKNGNNDVLAWYKGPSVLQKLTEISYTVQMPASKFDNANSSVVILRYKSLENTKNIVILAKTQSYLVYGYITQGAIAVGDTLYLKPNYYKMVTCKRAAPNSYPIPVKVLSIKYFDKERKEALVGTFVGLHIQFECEKYIKQFTRLNYYQYLGLLDHFMMPIYHSLSTTKLEKSPIRIATDLIVVASKSGHWDGKLKIGTTAGFYSYIARAHCKITEIESSTDAKGENFVEKPSFITKGQRARVVLSFSTPCKVRVHKKDGTGEGRLLLVMHNKVVAIGVITRIDRYGIDSDDYWANHNVLHIAV